MHPRRMLKRSVQQGRRRVETGGVPPGGTLRISMSRERSWRSFSASCSEVQDRRSNRRIARHPAATPAANMTPTIQPDEKPILLGSRRRSSRFRFGMWDSGPSHSSSDGRVEAFLKRMVVFPSPMIPSFPPSPWIPILPTQREPRILGRTITGKVCPGLIDLRGRSWFVDLAI